MRHVLGLHKSDKVRYKSYKEGQSSTTTPSFHAYRRMGYYGVLIRVKRQNTHLMLAVI